MPPRSKYTRSQGAARAAEHVWSAGWVDIMKEGMAPQTAADKAFRRAEEIFAKYPIVQT